MNGLLDILLAAKDDGKNWINVLIPVIIVIVYAISGILKMRSNLDKEQQPTEEQQKPRYKPLDDQSRGWERPSPEPAAPEISPAQRRQVDRQIEHKLAPEPTAARPKQRKTLEAFLETVAPKPLIAAASQPAAAPDRQEQLRAQTAQRQQAARKIKRKPAPRTAKPAARAEKKPAPQPSPITSIGERLAQPDEIRRAIIYAEILGKPIALRDM